MEKTITVPPDGAVLVDRQTADYLWSYQYDAPIGFSGK